MTRFAVAHYNQYDAELSIEFHEAINEMAAIKMHSKAAEIKWINH